MKSILKFTFVIFGLLYALSNTLVAHKIPTNQKTFLFLNEVFNDNKNFQTEHDPAFFKEFKDHQTPHATHLGCADSRVHMLSMDQTPQNDVFSIRNIGNQIATSEGSIDYGVLNLKTPILVIVGHSGCGAVEAALAGKEVKIPTINQELSTLKLTEKDINKAIIENVNNQVSIAISKYKNKVNSGELAVFGMLYDFKNDFNTGYGKLIMINVNGITDYKLIKEAYESKVKNIQCLQ